MEKFSSVTFGREPCPGHTSLLPADTPQCPLPYPHIGQTQARGQRAFWYDPHQMHPDHKAAGRRLESESGEADGRCWDMAVFILTAAACGHIFVEESGGGGGGAVLWSQSLVQNHICSTYSPGNSQFSSVTQSCLTLCNPMNHSMPGLPVHHQLPESTQTHVHRVGDAIQPSHLCRPLLLLPSIFPSIRVFSNESALRVRWPKYWSFSFNISPSVLPVSPSSYFLIT